MSSIPSYRNMPNGGYPPPYGPPGNPSFHPQLNSVLNLDPLAYQVYGAFPPTGANPSGSGNQPNPYSYTDPVPPSYVGDSPIGFVQNVLDPMLAPVTQTYRQTAAMVDDYLKNKKS